MTGNIKYQPNWSSLDSRRIPSWFQSAKFGIFIHWGVYSVPAWRKISDERFGSYAEWYYASVYSDYKNNDDDFHGRIYGKDFKYRNFVKDFKAELFDPDLWAEMFKEAGARYVVLTSKHHEGYCMWPTTNKHKKNWRVTDVGPNRDLLGDLSAAVRKQGMKMGLYYSIIDWETNWSHRPEGGYFVPERDRELYGIDEDKYVDEILIPQLKELVNTYKPALIFTDGGEWDFSEEDSKVKEFLAWLYNEAPNKNEVVINDRFCVGMPGKHGDYYSTEYRDIEGYGFIHPWEESRGIGKSYGFNRAENLWDYNTSTELIHELIEIVSRGGNLLLNVGPTADGRIPVIQQQRLKDIGDWLNINGKAIYETMPSNRVQSKEKEIFITETNKCNYVICRKWFDDEIEIYISDGLKIKNISLIGYNGDIKYYQDGNAVKIESPIVSPNTYQNSHAYVYELEIERKCE
ncbi:alpha-L-fucosidase [Maledivibacter halophilus]|uniref:alpha-L-fucosidase n=1 Tax=Maledivibacter halophilus TaxID=36842 RepID=A0A1T5LTI5_9FIRM|nr:alpha-L-fucosidase [Maledivibacter halophilus]SKC79145.1 alpha-L-fucosidase [Maledivibacter halophilus]